EPASRDASWVPGVGKRAGGILPWPEERGRRAAPWKKKLALAAATIAKIDAPTLRRSDAPTLRRSDAPTLRRSDAPTLRRSHCGNKSSASFPRKRVSSSSRKFWLAKQRSLAGRSGCTLARAGKERYKDGRDRLHPERRHVDVADSGLQHRLDRGVCGTPFLFSPGHDPCGRISQGIVEYHSAPEFR